MRRTAAHFNRIGQSVERMDRNSKWCDPRSDKRTVLNAVECFAHQHKTSTLSWVLSSLSTTLYLVVKHLGYRDHFGTLGPPPSGQVGPKTANAWTSPPGQVDPMTMTCRSKQQPRSFRVEYCYASAPYAQLFLLLKCLLFGAETRQKGCASIQPVHGESRTRQRTVNHMLPTCTNTLALDRFSFSAVLSRGTAFGSGGALEPVRSEPSHRLHASSFL
ncbi:hypothetical protein PHSY_003615 [Pseudozyma hubeiensis SY62]|uniref:Uncharacterized protein n=1 Tax=Pseudozyma hubeiensis (strain SY62) TaxID=1305764 RepID=R9P3U8_PSEHS|nr:hypothetical protein PHSY_003615 [Pseudozyma hubeiensis SY62]GAC96036.1 hypothetical protein PHSY_003615 [Pseudozyma hubeiensis SY62]